MQARSIRRRFHRVVTPHRFHHMLSHIARVSECFHRTVHTSAPCVRPTSASTVQTARAPQAETHGGKAFLPVHSRVSPFGPSVM